MNIVYLAIAFIGGVLFWGRLGGILLKRFFGHSEMENILKNLETEKLVAHENAIRKEMERRRNTLESHAGGKK